MSRWLSFLAIFYDQAGVAFEVEVPARISRIPRVSLTPPEDGIGEAFAIDIRRPYLDSIGIRLSDLGFGLRYFVYDDVVYSIGESLYYGSRRETVQVALYSAAEISTPSTARPEGTSTGMVEHVTPEDVGVFRGVTVRSIVITSPAPSESVFGSAELAAVLIGFPAGIDAIFKWTVLSGGATIEGTTLNAPDPVPDEGAVVSIAVEATVDGTTYDDQINVTFEKTADAPAFRVRRINDSPYRFNAAARNSFGAQIYPVFYFALEGGELPYEVEITVTAGYIGGTGQTLQRATYEVDAEAIISQEVVGSALASGVISCVVTDTSGATAQASCVYIGQRVDAEAFGEVLSPADYIQGTPRDVVAGSKAVVTVKPSPFPFFKQVVENSVGARSIRPKPWEPPGVPTDELRAGRRGPSGFVWAGADYPSGEHTETVVFKRVGQSIAGAGGTYLEFNVAPDDPTISWAVAPGTNYLEEVELEFLGETYDWFVHLIGPIVADGVYKGYIDDKIDVAAAFQRDGDYGWTGGELTPLTGIATGHQNPLSTDIRVKTFDRDGTPTTYDGALLTRVHSTDGLIGIAALSPPAKPVYFGFSVAARRWEGLHVTHDVKVLAQVGGATAVPHPFPVQLSSSALDFSFEIVEAVPTWAHNGKARTIGERGATPMAVVTVPDVAALASGRRTGTITGSVDAPAMSVEKHFSFVDFGGNSSPSSGAPPQTMMAIEKGGGNLPKQRIQAATIVYAEANRGGAPVAVVWFTATPE